METAESPKYLLSPAVPGSPPGRIDKRCATDQDLSALAAIPSTERGVMQVRLMRVRRGSPHLTSPCDGAHCGYFATQSVWRYAASLAGSAAIRRSAYY
jgi:hypothetical protein